MSDIAVSAIIPTSRSAAGGDPAAAPEAVVFEQRLAEQAAATAGRPAQEVIGAATPVAGLAREVAESLGHFLDRSAIMARAASDPARPSDVRFDRLLEAMTRTLDFAVEGTLVTRSASQLSGSVNTLMRG